MQVSQCCCSGPHLLIWHSLLVLIQVSAAQAVSSNSLWLGFLPSFLLWSQFLFCFPVYTKFFLYTSLTASRSKSVKEAKRAQSFLPFLQFSFYHLYCFKSVSFPVLSCQTFWKKTRVIFLISPPFFLCKLVRTTQLILSISKSISSIQISSKIRVIFAADTCAFLLLILCFVSLPG